MNSLVEEIRKFMEIEPTLKRMDSMMIEFNIKKMGRLELLYTYLANLVRTIHRDDRDNLLGGLEPYADTNNHNRIVYYEKDIPQNERLQKVLDDASKFFPLYKEDYEHTKDYQLLLRVITEQTKSDDTGNRTPKTKADGFNATVLQNPSDPDAVFHVKANKQYCGYSVNLTETVSENGSVITDYQYDVNICSDDELIKESIGKSETLEETITMIADGAYSGQEIQKLAPRKNINVLTTGLSGRKSKEILTEFQVAEDGKTILSCPQGYKPKSCS